MKIDILANTSDEPRGSMDATSESSSLSSESSDGDNMEPTGDIEVIQELKQKLASAETTILNQNEKIKLYEATIKDKNDLIKSLNTSIELLKETKELMIKQLKDEITDLQNALDLSKNLTINKVDAYPAESAEFEKKTPENADIQTLLKLDEYQSQTATLADNMSQLKAEMAELKSKMGEKDDEMENLKAKYKSQEDNFKVKIAELKNKAKIDATKLKESQSTKVTSNGFGSRDDSIILLNHSKVPNIKLIQTDIGSFTAIFEDIPFASPDWMVILRRFDETLSFYSDNGLKGSLGQVNGEYFLGLELIHNLTSSRRHELYIELVDFDDVKVYARYDNFVVGSQEEGYTLKSLGAYSGNAGDALRSHEKRKWVNTYFKNFCLWWWFAGSDLANHCCLTGTYTKSKVEVEFNGGMYWGSWYMGKRYSLKSCKMLIRPKL